MLGLIKPVRKHQKKDGVFFRGKVYDTYEATAKDNGITKERVRQLCAHGNHLDCFILMPGYTFEQSKVLKEKQREARLLMNLSPENRRKVLIHGMVFDSKVRVNRDLNKFGLVYGNTIYGDRKRLKEVLEELKGYKIVILRSVREVQWLSSIPLEEITDIDEYIRPKNIRLLAQNRSCP